MKGESVTIFRQLLVSVKRRNYWCLVKNLTQSSQSFAKTMQEKNLFSNGGLRKDILCFARM